MAKLNNESKQIMYAHAPMHTQAYTQVYRHANRPLISHSGVEESTMWPPKNYLKKVLDYFLGPNSDTKSQYKFKGNNLKKRLTIVQTLVTALHSTAGIERPEY